MHRPELVLCRRAHRGFSGGHGVDVHRQRKVDVGEANLARLHVLVAQHRIGLVVPLLAVGALEIAYFDHPDGCCCAALNPGEVGARNVGVRGRAARDSGCLGAGNRSAFSALSRGAGWSAGDCKRDRHDATCAVDLVGKHLLNRPPAKL